MQCSDRYGGARPFRRFWLWLAFRVRVRVRYGVTRVRNGDFLGYKYPGGGGKCPVHSLRFSGGTISRETVAGDAATCRQRSEVVHAA